MRAFALPELTYFPPILYLNQTCQVILPAHLPGPLPPIPAGRPDSYRYVLFENGQSRLNNLL